VALLYGVTYAPGGGLIVRKHTERRKLGEQMRADDADGRMQRLAGAGRGTSGPFAVLFIDPDVQRAEALARPMRSAWTVAIVPSARAAADAIKARLPDLIITDLDLPDAAGIRFLTDLHNTRLTRHVLLLVVTSRSAIGDKIAAFQAGADDYLVRPVDPELLALHVQLLSRFRRHFPQ
jgi:DNA-binding response OmpR family regulator